MTDVTLKISTTTTKNGNQTYTGTIAIPGLKPTRVVRKDQTSEFGSRSALMATARNVASNLGQTLVVQPPALPLKKAAKKSVKKSA
jgi:hypothetical protein